MPGFIKTKSDEKKWSKAKKAASSSTKKGSEGFWKLSNYIWHKMNKSEESQVPKHPSVQKLWDFLRTTKDK
jgi:hypothetical protein